MVFSPQKILLLLLLLLGILAVPCLQADVDTGAPSLVRVDHAAIRRRGEETLLSRIPGSKAADFRFLCLYYKYDPAKPVNEEVLTLVFLELAPVETRGEEIAQGVTKLVSKRRQQIVEMGPDGATLRVFSRLVEQSEMVTPK
jgi:hypothetical protein